ncbi:hypothetical protein [Paenibacillus ottowii]|uniref:hypothetical protein n=1 Tax=Paenibacillus ottowii TaxID=2315729 RepID=UPI001FCB0D9E|nr:hypothetical protein [Paenibacillus ottowii]
MGLGADQERDETAARTDHSSDCCCPWIPNWTTCKGWNPGAKASANASPERFRPLRCFQHQLSCGSRAREGAAHKMPHLSKTDRKAVSHCFSIAASNRSWKDCRICAANSPQSFQERARLKERSLEPPVRTDVKALLDEACAKQASSSGTRLPALQLQQLVIPCSPANPCGSPEGSSPGGLPEGRI